MYDQNIDLGALISLITVAFSVLAFLFRMMIGTPMNNLSNSIDKLSQRIDEDLRAVDDRLDEHEIHLARHDEQINTLFNSKEQE